MGIFSHELTVHLDEHLLFPVDILVGWATQMSKILDKNFSTFDCHLIMKSGKRVIHRWFHVAPSSNILLYSEQRLFE